MTTTTTVAPAPAPTPAISARLSLITGVVVLVAAIVGIAVVNIVRPAQATSAAAVILTLAVPAVAGLFVAARVNYTAGTLLATQAEHGATLTTIQTQLNGTLDGRIKDAVRAVLTELGVVGAALFPAATSPPATTTPTPPIPAVAPSVLTTTPAIPAQAPPLM